MRSCLGSLILVCGGLTKITLIKRILILMIDLLDLFFAEDGEQPVLAGAM